MNVKGTQLHMRLSPRECACVDMLVEELDRNTALPNRRHTRSDAVRLALFEAEGRRLSEHPALETATATA